MGNVVVLIVMLFIIRLSYLGCFSKDNALVGFILSWIRYRRDSNETRGRFVGYYGFFFNLALHSDLTNTI